MSYDLPEVTRIHTERGSHIEPPLNEDATDLDALLWHAAVTQHDTGIRIIVAHGSFTINGKPGPPAVSIQIGNGSTVHTYGEAWTYLNGVSAGARAATEDQE